MAKPPILKKKKNIHNFATFKSIKSKLYTGHICVAYYLMQQIACPRIPHTPSYERSKFDITLRHNYTGLTSIISKVNLQTSEVPLKCVKTVESYCKLKL